MDLFEKVLSVAVEDISLELRGVGPLPWANHWLNPRRLRGSDFLMRWAQGQWSEERVAQAVAQTGAFLALPYGPSGTAPDNDVRAFELYFEKLEKAGLGDLKRPDLLIFKEQDRPDIETMVAELGGGPELPFVSEEDPRLRRILKRAILAVECENSLWRASKMPAYGALLKPQRRLGGRPGLPKSAVLPTVIVKEEDREPIRKWQAANGVRVHVWHVFYDLAFGVCFDRIEQLISEGLVEPITQVFQAPGGPTQRKIIYKVYYHYAYRLASSVKEPTLQACFIDDKNGHILPYVKFSGGELELHAEALGVLRRTIGERDHQS